MREWVCQPVSEDRRAWFEEGYSKICSCYNSWEDSSSCFDSLHVTSDQTTSSEVACLRLVSVVMQCGPLTWP